MIKTKFILLEKINFESFFVLYSYISYFILFFFKIRKLLVWKKDYYFNLCLSFSNRIIMWQRESKSLKTWESVTKKHIGVYDNEIKKKFYFRLTKPLWCDFLSYYRNHLKLNYQFFFNGSLTMGWRAFLCQINRLLIKRYVWKSLFILYLTYLMI